MMGEEFSLAGFIGFQKIWLVQRRKDNRLDK